MKEGGLKNLKPYNYKMKIAIVNQGNGNIVSVKEYEPIESRGEIAHFLAELESIKLDLLELWEEEK
jgi:hypothetical protein